MQQNTSTPTFLRGLSFDEHSSLEPRLKASQIVKDAGLPSLNFCAAMIGERRTNNLTNWAKSRPDFFRVIVAGCVALKAEYDAKIPAGLVAVRNHALAHGMTQAELDAFGGVKAIVKFSMLPDDESVRLYDYQIWEYYYRVNGSEVILLSAPSPAAHKKQIEAVKRLGVTKAHKRQIQIESGKTAVRGRS
jgi:hypothetical protein